MSNAAPGKQYTVQVGDTLSSIALQAYGDSTYSTRIAAANQSSLKSDDPDNIFPGEIITIPILSEDQALRTELAALTVDNEDDLTIIVNGKRIFPVSANIFRSMDNLVDGWTAHVDWKPGVDTELDEAFRPYAYHNASVYIGGNLIINGVLYNTAPAESNAGVTMDLEGFSFTADLADSTLKPPYERNNITLEQLAPELVRPIGINAVFDYDTGGKFDRITATAGDPIGEHIMKYAAQRGFLVTSNVSGDLLVTKSNSGGPVGTLEVGRNLLEISARFNGRNRYNVYRAIGQSPGGNAKVGIAKDTAVPRSRFLTFNANDTIAGNIQTAADWKRSKQLADALTIPIPYDSWYAPNGELWRENTRVTVISQGLSIPNGLDFIIRSVSYIFSTEGLTSVLNVVPPQVFTGESLEGVI